MTDPEQLLAAQVAFEKGDFAEVRAITTRLSASLDADVRKQAVALRKRVSIDPVSVVIVLVCVAFFAAVCASYFGAR